MDLILILLIIGVPALASLGVRTTYSKYSKIQNRKNKTGAEVAREILDKNGLSNIYVVATDGTLTDHYDPTRKVIRLSKAIYEGSSVASMAVAAHECGHAIQDKDGYVPLRIRSAIYPVVNAATSIAYWIIFIGFIFQAADLIYLGIAFTVLGLLFQIITLPVEFNASSRAKQIVKKLGIASSYDEEGVKNMLTAAALTYVAGVIASAMQILRLLLIANDRRR